MAQVHKSSEGQEKTGANFAVSVPSISLPKGGGAIRGIGEKFAANPVSGTGSMTVPIAVSPGRSGFGPQLNLSYDSGSGNGVFGLGWSLSIPSITRKTDKGLPHYFDAIESDEFILSGAEDLVPVLGKDDKPLTKQRDGYLIQLYRPRIEGLFARIERWTNLSDYTDAFWRSISKENITTWYGKSRNSRIADPASPQRIFTWLICESHDDKGNVIVYRYKEENSERIFEDVNSQAVEKTHERNRSDTSRSANRYLKQVSYGNRTPYFPKSVVDAPPSEPDQWLFEVVFDFGEHDEKVPRPSETIKWPCRNDPFSSYRAGFEVRTYRLCQRVLMFHRFTELGKTPCLVRSTDFTYRYEQEITDSRNPIYSYLTLVTQAGYKSDGNQYIKKVLPPLEFEYTHAAIKETLEVVNPESLENLPIGLDGSTYQWADLDGEGTSGILVEQGEAWHYKRNLSAHESSVCFGALEEIKLKPVNSFSRGAQLLDLAGDGQVDLVQMDGSAVGFYERTDNANWAAFKPFTSWPNLKMHDPNLKFVDLSGDGHADILITEGEALTWYPSLAEEGFGPAIRVSLSSDEEKGPRLIFADGTQSIYQADLSGDGLTDLVRIRNGEICYWPNLGYGQFGAKVTMDNAPHFDYPDQLNQQYIRLADIDGSGTTDIIYLGRDGVAIYFNQSGNSWSKKYELGQFAKVNNLSSVMVLDLLGNGTACLVWSSPLAGDARQPMKYIDLMGGQKPHVLVSVKNNLGAETRVTYKPSTYFYLDDKENGRPWITRLPFPVHVVERVETYDYISHNYFVTRYAYHHGYFDGIEREFRGFGMVEQRDTEEYDALNGGKNFPVGVNIDEKSHVPTILTKTWFHTGAYFEGRKISQQFEHEYYREPNISEAQFQAQLLPDTILPEGLSADEIYEACRALKGSILRQEIYAEDKSPERDKPYSVSERSYVLKRLQPRATNQHAVFFTHASETIDYHYERHPNDPRIAHVLNLAVDEFGNVLKSVSVGYGRRQPDAKLAPQDQAKQTQILLTYTENDFTNAIDQDDHYRAPLPTETRTFELTGFTLALGVIRFGLSDFARNDFSALKSAVEIPYEQASDKTQKQKRIIEHVRTLYRRDDLGGPLPLKVIEALALPYETYKLAFTPGLVTTAYSGRVTDSMLKNEGGYVHSQGDANWWIPSGRVLYSRDGLELEYARQHFYLPVRYLDPFGQPTTVTFDGYDLLILETCDALGNKVTAGERNQNGNLTARGNDYRVLQPVLVMDPNRNRSAVAFDALGMVVGTSVMGKPEEKKGDSLDGFKADLSDDEIRIHTEYPLLNPHSILADATTRLVYDLTTYERTKQDEQQQPAVVYTLARETHVADLDKNQQTKIQHSFSYSDGFGREIQKKIQAEAGPVPKRDESGKIIVGENRQPEMTEDDVSPRWVGSGWTIFNNKGKPVRQYEPFFSDTNQFEFEACIGVSPTLCYDPLERVVATLHPNYTYEKVVFDPWQQATWDVNDTVLEIDPKNDADVGDFFKRLSEAEYLPTWYSQRKDGGQGSQEQAAAKKTAIHANTPTRAYFDTLGRTFLTVTQNRYERNGALQDEEYATRVMLDIEGNQREVVDAQNRVVMRYDYNLLGTRIHQASMEAGERWTFGDVTGKPIYGWDSREHTLRTTYDELRRPIDVYLREKAGGEIVVQRTVYGETQPTPEKTNLRGKVVTVYDGAGIITSDDYDFKGNLKTSKRKLAIKYKKTLDWTNPQAVTCEEKDYEASTTYDAQNRPLALKTPDKSVVRPKYNEANLLKGIDAQLHGKGNFMPFVKNINYNEKGQRKKIVYGNEAVTEYDYDWQTFRLTNLKSTRPKFAEGERTLQDLKYTYDPAGNITSIRDDAQQAIYFKGQVMEAHNDYTYDAIYRLISATGREHIGQTGQSVPPAWDDHERVGLAHPHDGQAMRRYAERYEYDEVGNFLRMIHAAANGNWTRTYAYNEPSLLESGKNSNRLSRTQVGTALEPYAYDAHGNMSAMPHLSLMEWDYRDQLSTTSRQTVNSSGTPETTYYVYDAQGQRVRKVTERQAASGQTTTRKSERIYLGGYEIYREYNEKGKTLTLERETLHIMDDKQRVALVETKLSTGLFSFIGKATGQEKPLVRYEFGNHLGSAYLELDENIQIVSYEEYTPYGSTSYQAVRSQTDTSKRYRYTGKERDDESGLYYYGARYYVPWLGVWAKCDPKGIEGEFNLYFYVNNRPTIANDPDGMAINIVIGAGLGALIGGGIEAGRQLIHDGRISNWGNIGASAAGGAVSGGLAGLTMGGSLLVQAGVAGSASVAGGATTRALTGQDQSLMASAQDFAVGVVTFGLVKGGASVVQSVAKKLKSSSPDVGKVVDQASWKSSEKSGNKIKAETKDSPHTTISGIEFEKKVLSENKNLVDLNLIAESKHVGRGRNFRIVDAVEMHNGNAIVSIASGTNKQLTEKFAILMGEGRDPRLFASMIDDLTTTNFLTGGKQEFIERAQLWVPKGQADELKKAISDSVWGKDLIEKYGAEFILGKVVEK